MKAYFILLTVILFIGFQQCGNKPTGNRSKSDSIVVQVAPPAPVYSFDTFVLIRTCFQKPGTKAVFKDTFVLIAKDISRRVSATKAPYWYHMEAAPFNQSDSGKTAGVKRDTMVWTWKPYRF
jgi:hypothetical protein